MTPAEFKLAMPEFESTNDIRIAYWLDLDDDEKPTSGSWGGLYSRGLANWVAYNLTLEAQRAAVVGGGGTGISAGVVEVKVGTESIKYSDKAAEAAIANPYKGNSYGNEFLRLRDLTYGGGFVA